MFYQPLLMFLKGVKVHNFDESRENSLNPLEIQLQEELVALERPDLAEAVGGSGKYQRLELAFAGEPMSYESFAGMRLAFDPNAAVPDSKAAWLAEGKIRFATDSGFQAVIAAYDKVLAEEKLEAEGEAAEAPVPNASADASEGGDDSRDAIEATEESRNSVAETQAPSQLTKEGWRKHASSPFRSVLQLLQRRGIRMSPT